MANINYSDVTASTSSAIVNEGIDFTNAFMSWAGSRSVYEKMLQASSDADPMILVLAFEGLFQIGNDGMGTDQFETAPGFDAVKNVKNFLRVWRCNAPINYSHSLVPAVLYNLLVFKDFSIPLFIGNCGEKLSLTDFSEDDIEEISIDLDAPLERVQSDAENRSTMKGKWYRIINVSDSNGSDSESDDIAHLDSSIKGLQQGEIVYKYDKNEVCVILYAEYGSHEDLKDLKKPTLAAIKKKYNTDTQISLLVLVPKRPRGNLCWEVNDEQCAKIVETNHRMSKDEMFKDKVVEKKSLDLVEAFVSLEGCNKFFMSFVRELTKTKNPAIPVIAMEGIYRLERKVNAVLGKCKSHKFPVPSSQDDCCIAREMQHFLRKWRSNSRIGIFEDSYDWVKGKVEGFIRRLSVFRTLEIPLFIDTLGQIRFLHSFSVNDLEDIQISANTTVMHVTHRKEAKDIADQRKINGSLKKNCVEGVWFGYDTIEKSLYGSKGFKTTLRKLGVTGLYQGEIVYYKKHERNVILYATDEVDANFEGLKKLKESFVRKEGNEHAHVEVSIFVPSRLLPSEEEFWNVFSELVKVNHERSFCLRALRSRFSIPCPDP